MNRLLAATLAVAIVLSGAGAARAADPVNAVATIDRTTITVGDRIALAVIVDAEPGYLPSDPTLARRIGSFEVVQTQAAQKSTRGSLIRFTYKYAITAWTLGDLVLPSIAVPYIGPNGLSGTAQTAEATVKVVTVASPGERLDEIKPLKPQLGVAEAVWPRITRFGVGLALACAIGLTAFVLFWLLLRRRGVLALEPRLTPAQRALRELDELVALKLPEQGRTAEHYGRLTASLRRYAVDRFGVQPGRTSREVRDALERAGLERTAAASIYEILREGDEVRFRNSVPYPAHAQNAVRAALQIIRRAASAEQYETAALQTQ
jgi:hypothetical protein